MESRAEVRELLELDRLIDLLIPRGSGELVRSIQENTRIPVLGHAEGVCHLYVDEEADLAMAVELAYDAKCQYPAVCNAIETLLVHERVAREFLPRLAARLAGVELRGDERTRAIIPALAATEEDWRAEYNDLILAVRVVDSLEAGHRSTSTATAATTPMPSSPATQAAARRFLAEVDSSSVMWNCSTRFADGYRYGLGAEVGIATGKIHARGPVGLEGLTSTKFLLEGRGQVVADYAEGRRRFTPPGPGMRLLIKIGSALISRGSRIDYRWLKGKVREIAALARAGEQIALVTSGRGGRGHGDPRLEPAPPRHPAAAAAVGHGADQADEVLQGPVQALRHPRRPGPADPPQLLHPERGEDHPGDHGGLPGPGHHPHRERERHGQQGGGGGPAGVQRQRHPGRPGGRAPASRAPR